VHKGEAQDMSTLRKAVVIVVDPKSIRLLADFTRTEILRLLSKYPMTETQLSEQLGITRAAVGYHLHLLTEAGLITIEKVEPEQHGILQKYYAPLAFLFIIDPDHVPQDVKRYYVRMQIEHLRGMFSVFKLYHRVSEVSSENFEKLAVAMLRQLKIVGQKHTKDNAPKDAESLRVKIYAEALSNLTKEKEWRSLFQR
jgi:DNA-binding transcriptional ArsR family regulator